jgi:phospho-N-acetylmuramoyl-pentapeptide-transferase
MMELAHTLGVGEKTIFTGRVPHQDIPKYFAAADVALDVPTFVWVLWAGAIIWATTNAVNVTDGLDGLAGGSALMGFGAFMIIAYWAFRNPDVYGAVVNPLDMGVMAAGFAGACLGFLWWNAAPARIFMGDVGALAIGSALAFFALTLNTQILLLLICGINVMEAGSVAIQMGVFKASGRTRRLFRMSPIHHHFELSGWPETTVIIRFWLISAICVASALAIFFADYTRVVG